MRRRIAIITARGGSKRIPKKNIREFCGKPILAYVIQAAMESELFDEVMVSTDSTEIAEVAKKYGAKIPFLRSSKTSGDYATTSEVILEVLEEYDKMKSNFDTLVCIYPTAPFLTADKLRAAVAKLENTDCIEVLPVVRFSYPPQRGFVRKDQYIEMQHPKYKFSRSQDLETMYHDAGQFYCFRVDEYLKCEGRVTEKIVPFEISELEVQDIDNEVDWKLAELKYKFLHGLDERG